jgi:hypothetical protein
MEELKIQVPDGYEVDKENSTFEVIKFKKKKGLPSSWEDLKVVSGWFIGYDSNSDDITNIATIQDNRNVFATKEQAEAAIALAQLSQLKKVYREFEGGEIDWREKYDWKYIIRIFYDEVREDSCTQGASFLAFTKKETRDLFYDNFKDLIEKAKPLLQGE